MTEDSKKVEAEMRKKMAVEDIKQKHAIFKENNGFGKAWCNDLFDSILNYMLGPDSPVGEVQFMPTEQTTSLPMNDMTVAQYRERMEYQKAVDKMMLEARLKRAKLMEHLTKYPMPKDVDKYRQEAKIAAGIVFYNDENLLERCLKSLKDFDLVICMDGVYDVAPMGKSPLSTDRSREIVRSFRNTFLVDMPFMPQPTVRNHYLDEAVWNGCDYLLVFEADEYITGNMAEFRKNLPVHDRKERHQDIVYNMWMQWAGEGDHWVHSPRFFYKPGLVRYGGTHSTYVVNGLAMITKNGDNNLPPPLEGIKVVHDERGRTKEQEARSTEYKNNLVTQEKIERETLGRAGRRV